MSHVFAPPPPPPTHTHTKRLPKLLPNHPTPAQASGQVAPTSPPQVCAQLPQVTFEKADLQILLPDQL